MFSPGMYSELNPVYNEVCPPSQMEGNIFNQQHQLPPPYPEQYSSPVDTHNQQLSAVAFGAHPSDQRTFSPPGMSGSAGDLRSMGLPTHISANAEPLASTSPRGHISAANRPDMQWMVTTSHIDMRTLTPPSSVMSQSSLPHGSGMNSSVATISHSSYAGPSAAVAEQKPIARNKNGKPKGTPGRKRKVEDHDLTPEEAAKRRVRRERNKLAAAKCRNRRRELTDRLQGETDILEDHQGMLTQEIIALQQEKDHLEFILASHTPRCKVLQDKSLNLMGNQSPPNVQCSNSGDCMGMHDHADHCANLVPPIDMSGDLGDMHPSRRQQATTVSVIQAGPSLTGSSRSMNENMYPNNSSIVGNENMMHAQYSLQSDDPRNPVHGTEHEGRFPATLANLDDLEQVVGEPLNTPVCTLATPSNTTAVFTFPNTPCVTSNSLANSGMNFADAFANADYNCSTSGSVMSTGNFLHPNQAQYNVGSTSVETCSAAHRRSSSSESHHSPDSVVQSPTLLSL